MEKKYKALVVDIETLGENFDEMDETTQHILTRWISKEVKDEGEYNVALAGIKDGLGFSPLTGKIVTIGMFDVDSGKSIICYEAPDRLPTSERDGDAIYQIASEAEMLRIFWDKVTKFEQVVTFNGYRFDLPYILVRSLVHRVRPTVDLMSNRYLTSQKGIMKHIDLVDQLTYYGAMQKRGTLHVWCRALGIKSPKSDGVDGDDVAQLYKAGRFLDIARYNLGDLEATAELYKRWLDNLPQETSSLRY